MTNWIPNLNSHPGPRYRAIADAIADAVIKGDLALGTRLPTHRDLAYRLGVTTGTVTRAYAEAERRGLIGGEVGRGTFVKGSPRLDAALEIPRDPPPGAVPMPGAGAIDLTRGQPCLAGVDGLIAEATTRMWARGGMERLLGYQPRTGLESHRAVGAIWLGRFGLSVGSERVLVSEGGQNGIALSLLASAAPGDVVLTEQMTYGGIKVAAATLGMRLHPVAMDGDGLLPDALEAACRTLQPRALYVTPNLHNPTLATLPLDRRQALVEIARAHRVTIIEDDVFGFLPDRPLPPLAALAPEQTIYLNSLSKCLAPGLRVGFISAAPAVIDRLAQVTRALHWMTCPLTAELVRIMIEDGTADRVAQMHRAEARSRLALVTDMLGVHGDGLPPVAMHVWLRLPEPWRRNDFADELLRRGVKVTPADAFMVGRAAAPHAVRLNITAPPRPRLEAALSVIAELLDRPETMCVSVV